jgi:hypothetical protein
MDGAKVLEIAQGAAVTDVYFYASLEQLLH